MELDFSRYRDRANRCLCENLGKKSFFSLCLDTQQVCQPTLAPLEFEFPKPPRV